jgi:hypothetical protein
LSTPHAQEETKDSRISFVHISHYSFFLLIQFIMNSSSFKKLSRSKKIGVFLIGTTLAYAAGLPLYIGTASAASLTDISDLIVSSAPGVATNHTIVYTTINAMVGSTNGTTTFQFAPGNSGGVADEFLLTSYATSTDFAISGSVAVTEVANAQSCTGAASEVYNSFVDNVTGSRIIGFAVCPGDTIAPQILTVSFTGSHVINPTTVNSYVVRVAGTQTDSADTRIAIISTVTMSAKVDTSLTFTITGQATSTNINGTTTTLTTTATAIPFNTVTPGIIYTAAQRLNVATNAQNGFQVTVVQNANLISSTGADIDLFRDSAETAVPEAWGAAPLNTLGNENTFGHYGITTADDTLSAGNPFGSNLWAGNFDAGSPLQIFWHDAPSDGLTVDVGSTTVGFQIQIGTLQEAANDYNNTLTYVATPIF